MFLMFKLSLEAILNLRFLKDSKSFYLLCSTSLLLFRWLSATNYMQLLHLLTVFWIIFQIVVILYIKKIVKKLGKHYFYINIFSLSIHIFNLFLVSGYDLSFFLGMEAAILIYMNLKNIPNSMIRLLLLVLIFIIFLKKYDDREIEYFQYFYFAYLLFLFQSFIAKNENLKEKETKNKELESKTRFSLSHSKSVKLNRKITVRKPYKYNTKRLSIPFFHEQNLAINIINIINQGIIVINKDFEIIYANPCSFEFFETKDLKEIKNRLFTLEENVDINESEFYKIPDLAIEQFFQNPMHFLDSKDSLIFDQIYEKANDKKKKLSLKFSRCKHDNDLNDNYQENSDSNFKGWEKRELSDNLPEGNFQKAQKNKRPITVLNYLKKLLSYCNETKELMKNNEIYDPNLMTFKETEKYTMYAKLEILEGATSTILLSFIPLVKSESTNQESSHEIMIIMRKMSCLEMKLKDGKKSQNKILGSFCHELRTPINGLINMLDLMETQISESQMLSEKLDGEFTECLTTAMISSHLLLNEIDDFIDYFAFCNELLEKSIASFDMICFFQEINKVFSYFCIKNNLDFSIVIDDQIPTRIYNDQRRLRQILYNLLSNFFIFFNHFKIILVNAIRFTNSGSITVTVDMKKNNFIKISVMDTGTGIRTEQLEKLGNIQNNLDSTNKSTSGFGLFISNVLSLLIESNDKAGKKGLKVYSQPGKGSCFCFSFKSDLNEITEDAIPSKANQNIEIEKKERLVFSPRSNSAGISEKKNLINSSSEVVTIKEISQSDEISKIMQPNSPLLDIENKKISTTDEIISSRSILSKKHLWERNVVREKTINYNSLVISDSDLSFFYGCDCPQVLIVDDVFFNIEVCRKLFKKKKIASDYANNGHEAVMKIENSLKNLNKKKFCAHCQFYKLILMDVDMPIMDGIEASREIKNLLKNTEITVDIIGLSAFHQEDIERQGREAGMVDYIVKPINSHILDDLILKYIHKC